MLNIWGVMLFIRLSWIVGEAGIGKCFSLRNDFPFRANPALGKHPALTMNGEREGKASETFHT